MPLCALGLAPLAATRWARSTARAAVAVAVVLVLVALQGLVHDAYGIGDGVANTVFAGAVAVLGLVWRRHATERRRAEALAADRAAAAREAREQAREQGRRAVDAERARIARELHDVVGHGLSVVVLQARGARAVLAADPARAREALDEVERAASGALREMRLLTGLLRTTDDAAGPPPGPPDLPALVGDVRRAGVPVTLDADALDDLPPGFAVTSYRVVQEALTNAARHAPGADVAVVVRRREQEVVVDVRNTAPPGASPPDAAPPDDAPPESAVPGVDLPSTGGRGLAGVRERATVLGGHVAAGPQEDGGFRVLVRLPVPPPAAAEVSEPARAAAEEAPA
ncbi:sensor histidine kinase [Kineococcus sp. SYSU DK004]|uniref:sensor histidine kinase n=1 Tax=Kineococcus sp. SYSU DK004 TaxID=3383125 RepID=UPI003D7DD046